jgi:hypothetical protein
MRASNNSTTAQKSLKRKRRAFDDAFCIGFLRAIERLLNISWSDAALSSLNRSLSVPSGGLANGSLSDVADQGANSDRRFRLAIDHLLIGLASMMWYARGRVGNEKLNADADRARKSASPIGTSSIGTAHIGSDGIDRLRAFFAVACASSPAPDRQLLEIILNEIFEVAIECGADDRFSFFVDLAPCKLAMLYEYALAFGPRWDSSAVREKLCSDDKSKKRLGNFYTPPALADLAVRNALSSLVYDSDGTVIPVEEILKLRVVDPASGGGSFLCSTLNYLDEVINKSADARNDNLTASKNWREEIAANCLYGVDLDAGAVTLCQTILFLESHAEDLSVFERLRFRIKRGNSLIGAWKHACEHYPERARQKLTAAHSKKRSVLVRQLDAIDLKTRMDLWCSIWFWNDQSSVPDQLEWPSPQARTLARSKTLSSRLGFFHWEIEFEDVFSGDNPGFDAVVGNPPWEIHKPNSREFFSRFDPLYWEYGKQRALLRQKQLCASDPQIERMWCEYEGEYASFRQFMKYCSCNAANSVDNSLFLDHRPFSHQGKADLNAYKLFLEQSLFLLRRDGTLSFIVPSSLYSDLGARELRLYLLKNFRWKKLLGFENSLGLFNIHRSFKFCIATVQKGEHTQNIETAFMLKDPANPPAYVIQYSQDAIQKFSPSAISIVEFEHRRDIEIMEKVFSCNNALASSDWNLRYEREFDMTNDSHLFLPRSDVEHSGYRADQYGNWLLGSWRKRENHDGDEAPDADSIVSVDGLYMIDVRDVEDVALPVYEGRMVGQFDFSQKAWVSGKGRRALWQELSENAKAFSPQYLMRLRHYPRSASEQPLKCGFLGVGSPTNSRSMIASALDTLPCGNSVPVLRTDSSLATLSLVACFNSYVFDFALRCRLSGNNLNYFLVAETPIISRALVISHPLIAQVAAALNLNHIRFSPYWLDLSSSIAETSKDRFNSFLAIGDAQRRTLRAFLDALIAQLYGLSVDDLSWILRDATSSERSLKGLWRSEQKVPPASRQSTLALRILCDLERQSEEELFDHLVSSIDDFHLLEQAELKLHSERIAHLRAHQFNLLQGTTVNQPRHD